jgi:hypothetical protein
MTEEIRYEIINYISKYRNSNDFSRINEDFNSRWLNSFDYQLRENVKMEFDYLRNERNIDTNDFIKSLENLLIS